MSRIARTSSIRSKTLRRTLSPELRLLIEDAGRDLQHSDERISFSPGVERDFLRMLQIVAKQIVALAAERGAKDPAHVSLIEMTRTRVEVRRPANRTLVVDDEPFRVRARRLISRE